MFSTHIKSYIVRTSKLSSRQSYAFTHHAGQYLVPYRAERIDCLSLFGNNNPIICDIGFGMGRGLIDQIQQYPQYNYIGIEVYPPGVGSTMALAAEHNITQLRIVQHDAIAVLTDMIADAALAKIQLLYPDPWPKKKHHKRRIIVPHFLDLVVQKLQPTGVFQIITDWSHYAEQIDATIAHDGRFSTRDAACFSECSWPDPMATNYAQKAVEKGHFIANKVFQLI